MATEQPVAEIRSLADALTAAAARLAAISDSPRLDANILLCKLLDCPRSFLLSHPETLLTAEQSAQFDALVARREKSEPVAYITSVKEFWSLELKVTPDVLIPRPETETLVEAALERLPVSTAGKILDLGTGSGAIALALATECPRWNLVGVDVSAAALDVARENARSHGLANVEFRNGSWYEPLQAERYDMIVSNPPYVAEGDAHLAALAFEPQGALVAANHGLAALEQIIAEAPTHLVAGGWLLLEHGADQAGATQLLLGKSGFAAIQTLPDLAGQPRVSIGRLIRSADLP